MSSPCSTGLQTTALCKVKQANKYGSRSDSSIDPESEYLCSEASHFAHGLHMRKNHTCITGRTHKCMNIRSYVEQVPARTRNK